MKPIDSREVEPVAHVPDDEKVDNICPECGADLFVVGIVEVLSGGYSETEICFEDSKTKVGRSDIQDFDEQWALCGKCKERIEYTAATIIDEFEKLHPPKLGGERMPLLTIEVKTPILPERMERLEDELGDFLNSRGIDAVIDSTLTGNTTVTKGAV